MGNDKHHDAPGDNAVNEGKKLRALKVQPAANLPDPLRHGQPACGTELLKRRSLIEQVRFVGLARDAHIHHRVTGKGALPLERMG
jgi:hypothetical protein